MTRQLGSILVANVRTDFRSGNGIFLKAGLRSRVAAAVTSRHPRRRSNTLAVAPARTLLLTCALLLNASTHSAHAQGSLPVDKVCALIESSARTNSLPVDFLARLIWQESRFKPDVIGVDTRAGRAQGIAQFMPATAAEHNLIEPFNPVEALPKSAEFLAQLRAQFGNLGLAAAAYNAGPKRVQDYLAGTRTLPVETRNYVMIITGKPVQAWGPPATQQQGTGTGTVDSEPHNLNCQDLVAHLEQRDSRPANMEKAVQMSRNVPSWCSGLRHPNPSMCGSVHMSVSPARANAALGSSAGRHRPRLNLTMTIAPPGRPSLQK